MHHCGDNIAEGVDSEGVVPGIEETHPCLEAIHLVGRLHPNALNFASLRIEHHHLSSDRIVALAEHRCPNRQTLAHCGFGIA